MAKHLYYLTAVLLTVLLLLSAYGMTESYAQLARSSDTSGRVSQVMKDFAEMLTLGLYDGGTTRENEMDAVRKTAEIYQGWVIGCTWTLAILSTLFLGWQAWEAHIDPEHRHVPFIRHLLGVSSLFLIIGLTAPILSVVVYKELPVVGQIIFSYKAKSITSMIWKLFTEGDRFIAVLLLLFSILTPVGKLGLSFVALGRRAGKLRSVAVRIVHHIGRWSMTDVFVVAILLAFLASGRPGATAASLGPGLYFFAGYGLISILAGQLMVSHEREFIR